MDVLLLAGMMTEVKDAQNVAYILHDNGQFLPTGYKVLKSQEKNGFIKCTKLLYNGKVKLLYFTSGYKSLKNMLPTLEADMFISIVTNLLSVVLGIQNNGFLSCSNLDLAFDKIFVDQKTLAVNLIYLPVNIPQGDAVSFENELRTQLIKIITSTPALTNERIKGFCAQLSDGNLSLRELYEQICAEQKGARPSAYIQGPSSARPAQSGQPELIFSAVNAPVHLAFKVSRPEFVIGKNTGAVDGAVTFNKAVSRIHCKLVYQNGAYYIMDMGSANGTYVNGSRIPPQQLQAVKNGDAVRLANSDFLIQI
ncbi:MAG: FHA domain-containing protein [Oscillospiraceae bacterium]|nr:FHA domain-containing protein [Oscillospiraceae bacterium]